MRMPNKLLFEPGGPALQEGVTGGVIPKIIVTGDVARLEERPNPRRRCRTAARSAGYHTDAEGASVGKSRMYIKRGRFSVEVGAPETFSSVGNGMFTSVSKKLSSLDGEAGFLEVGGTSGCPCIEDNTFGIEIDIWVGAANMKGNPWPS